MTDEELIDYTDPDIIARQNIAPNAGCNIDGKFYDVRNLVHLASSQADRIEALLNLNEALVELMDDRDAKLAKAVEALEPFAKAAETWEPDDGDSGLGARIEHPHHGLERHAEFTFGDLRRARATLAAVSETHKIKGESHDPL